MFQQPAFQAPLSLPKQPPPPELRRLPREPRDLQISLELVQEYYPQASDTEKAAMLERISSHIDCLRSAYVKIEDVKGKRVLDVACGSRAYEDNPYHKYDPWMSRLLLSLGAYPLGIDLQPQVDERFPSYTVDLFQRDSLGFVESSSFDAFYICAFPTRRAVQRMDEQGIEWFGIRAHILWHLQRVLKEDGRSIRTFTDQTELHIAKYRQPKSPERLTLPPRWFDDLSIDD